MRSRRYYERQIDKLLAIIERQNDRIMFLAGRTWEPSPAQLEPPVTVESLLDERYSWAPEQDPEDVEVR